MKILSNIKSSDIVAIDIETVRVSELYIDLDEGTQSAWEYKNKQDGQIPDNLGELWERTSSLYAEFSKVCAVSLAFLDKKGNPKCYEFFGDDEAEILENLGVILHNIGMNPNYRLVGHALKFFDAPFLCKRYVINGMDIPNILDVSHLKPWEQRNLCTNELWKMGGTGAGSSLQALCNALNIPISKVDLVGDEVGKAYYDKEYERISRYCSYDAIATFNIIRRFKGEPIFLFNEFDYIVKEKEEKVEKNILQKIVNEEPVQNIEVKKLIKKAEDAGEAGKPIVDLVNRYS